MSDCKVQGGDLSKLDSDDEIDRLLIESLGSTFARIDDAVDSLFKAVQATESLAQQAHQEIDDRYA
jgi:hypothetical protein